MKSSQAWQTGKRTPRNPEGIIEATVNWIRQYVDASQDSSAQQLLKEYLACKKKLSADVRKMVRNIPDSVLHHKTNLNPRTISNLRQGKDLRMDTLKRIASLLLPTDKPQEQAEAIKRIL